MLAPGALLAQWGALQDPISADGQRARHRRTAQHLCAEGAWAARAVSYIRLVPHAAEHTCMERTGRMQGWLSHAQVPDRNCCRWPVRIAPARRPSSSAQVHAAAAAAWTRSRTPGSSINVSWCGQSGSENVTISTYFPARVREAAGTCTVDGESPISEKDEWHGKDKANTGHRCRHPQSFVFMWESSET